MLSRSLQARMAQEHAHRQQFALLRERKVLDSPQAAELQLGDKKLLNFCSNDYLGLANDTRVKAAFAAGVRRWGCGAGAAHLVNGHSRAHHALEEALADFTGRSRALLFSTGYMANMGVINALSGPDDVVYADALNHASLLDGGWLSRGQMQRYPHADVVALSAKLNDQQQGAALITSDAVFSMDGDTAPARALAELAQQHDASLLLDDAHGLGVLGAKGGGVCELAGLSESDVPVLIGTLGKAFGSFGAFCAGSAELIEYLIQRARTYIYTTAMPAAVAEASLASLAIIQAEPWRRKRLQLLISKFRQAVVDMGWNLLPSNTPIQPILIGDAPTAMRLGAELQERGFMVTPIRPPTVPAGAARLRVTLTAMHTDAHLDALVNALAACQKTIMNEREGG